MPNLTRFALALMGKLRARPAIGPSEKSLTLPPAERTGGLPVMDALSRRRSTREFKSEPLPLPVLSSLLWAAWGVNRPDGNRTAPSAMDCQEIDLYVALPVAPTSTTPRRTRCTWPRRPTCGASPASRTSSTTRRSISSSSSTTPA